MLAGSHHCWWSVLGFTGVLAWAIISETGYGVAVNDIGASRDTCRVIGCSVLGFRAHWGSRAIRIRNSEWQLVKSVKDGAVVVISLWRGVMVAFVIASAGVGEGRAQIVDMKSIQGCMRHE
jgi:hypothetical protein